MRLLILLNIWLWDIRHNPKYLHDLFKVIIVTGKFLPQIKVHYHYHYHQTLAGDGFCTNIVWIIKYTTNEKYVYLMNYTVCGVARGIHCICKIEYTSALLLSA